MPSNPLDRLNRAQRQLASIAGAVTLAIIVLAVTAFSGSSPPARSLATDGPIPTVAPTTVRRSPGAVVPAPPAPAGSTGGPHPTPYAPTPVVTTTPTRRSTTTGPKPAAGANPPVAGFTLTTTTDLVNIPGE